MRTTIPIDEHRRVVLAPVAGWVSLELEGGTCALLEVNQARVLMNSIAWALEAIETQRTREAAGPRASDLQQPATE